MPPKNNRKINRSDTLTHDFPIKMSQHCSVLQITVIQTSDSEVMYYEFCSPDSQVLCEPGCSLAVDEILLLTKAKGFFFTGTVQRESPTDTPGEVCCANALDTNRMLEHATLLEKVCQSHHLQRMLQHPALRIITSILFYRAHKKRDLSTFILSMKFSTGLYTSHKAEELPLKSVTDEKNLQGEVL